MRISGGLLKGRHLHLPKNSSVRPTCSRLKEAFFNIMQQEIEGSVFLDLFSGSGSIGIEALSRGAASATFVEKDSQTALLLKRNLQEFNLTEKSTILCANVYTSLHRLLPSSRPYSIVYIDPPYDEITQIPKLLTDLTQVAPLSPHADIFLELRKNSFSDIFSQNLTLLDKRTYSDSTLWHFSLLFPVHDIMSTK